MFAIKDTGRGLSGEDQKRIFLPFSQADSSVTRKFGGTGLGLILARRLAEALGGNVVLKESDVNQGSTFVFSLDPGPLIGVPLLEGLTSLNLKARDESPRDPFVASEKLHDVRVLLVEDGPDNQILMAHILRASGAKVDSAVNGVEAVTMAAEQDYDIVLMDMQMPVLDGYEATKQLRAMGCTTPIVALTANAMRGERERCLAVGCVDYVAKPVKGHALISVVERIVAKH